MVADTYADVIQCIDANYPGFRKDLIVLADSGGDLAVEVGGNLLQDMPELITTLTNDTIVISPIPAGSSSNTAKVIIGTILIVTSFFVPQLAPFLGPYGTQIAGFLATTTAAVGANLAIIGLQQMLAPDPSVDEIQDYLFNGPENTTVSGNPVPVLCGELIIGGTIISAGSLGNNLGNDATFVGEGSPGNIFRPGSVLFLLFDTLTADWSASALNLNNEAIIIRATGETVD